MSEQGFNQTEFYKKFYQSWEKTFEEAFEMWTNSPLLNKESQAGNIKNLNPGEQYKKFYGVWEQTMSDALEMWQKTPLFASSIGKAIEKSSELKTYVDKMMEHALTNMHLPTKNDMDKTLAAINNIEEKINDLIERVEDLQSSSKK